MLKSFNQLYNDIVNDRIQEIEDDLAENNCECRGLTGEIIEKIHDIVKVLPQEHKGVLEELENIRERRNSKVKQILYRQGLMDGIKISKAYDKL